MPDEMKVEEFKFDEFPILVGVNEENDPEVFYVQTKDYRFAQFLQQIQNHSNLELIFATLEQGLGDEANQDSVDNLIHFCQLLRLWAKKSIEIDEDYISNLKGENHEPDSNSK